MPTRTNVQDAAVGRRSGGVAGRGLPAATVAGRRIAAVVAALGLAGLASADSATMRPLTPPPAPAADAPPAATPATEQTPTDTAASATDPSGAAEASPGSDRPSTSGRLLPREGRVDHLAMTDSEAGFEAGAFDGAAWRDGAVRPVGTSGASASGDLVALGAWTSPAVEAAVPARDVLPSWNADAPAGTGVRFDVRVRLVAASPGGGAGDWSPWLYVGSWGDVPRPNGARAVGGERVARKAKGDGPAADGAAMPVVFGGTGDGAGEAQPPADPAGPHVRRFDGGKVHVDVLTLDRPAAAYQVRATFYGTAGRDAAPSLRRLTVVTSGLSTDLPGGEAVAAGWAGGPASDPVYSAASPDLPWGVELGWSGVLDVPFVAQDAAPDEAVRGEVCSPTSTTMAMAFAGAARPMQENYRAILDPDTGIYGNWNRAVARAGQLGLDAWLRRFRSWDEVRAELAAGRPVVASINFEAGAFPSNVMDRTNGHLIVVRGLTPAGHAVVNDPASRERGEAVVYDADELARAWFDNAGGVGYVIARPSAGPVGAGE